MTHAFSKWFRISLLISLLFFATGLFAAPLQPDMPSWKLQSGKISDTIEFNLNASIQNPVSSYQVALYRSGSVDPIHTYGQEALAPAITVDTMYELDCSVQMIADYTSSTSKYEEYYVVVTASYNAESSSSNASDYNAKGLASLSINGILDFGSDADKIIYHKLSSSTFEFRSFTFSSATKTYNYMARNEVSSITITLPSQSQSNPNTYAISAIFDGSETLFSGSNLYENQSFAINRAAGSTGRDADGLPNAPENNNVVTITVNDGTDYEYSYTIRLRRRTFCPIASLGSISPAAPITISSSTAFSCSVTGGNGSYSPTPSDVNGDTIATKQDLLWQVVAFTGTGFFSGNTFYPLSNGTVRIKATSQDGSNIEQYPAGYYTITGQSNWYPHLGKIELKNAKSPFQVLDMAPNFSANNPSGTVYMEGIVDDFSSVNLSLMAPSDCQVYLNGVRIGNNSDTVLRMQPKTVAAPFNNYVVRVVNSLGERSYTIRVERDVKARLRYGRTTGDVPYLSAPDGEYFGMKAVGVNQAFTIQAWARWTSDPVNLTIHSWANIVTMDHSTSDQGQFWLQHNSSNTAFEFAFRAITSTNPLTYSRVHAPSVTVPQRGVWYHLTGVWNGSVIILYVNGVEEARRNLTGTFNTIPPTPKLWIGRSPSTSARLFTGNVRDVRMYVGSFRTAAQVMQDYLGTSSNTSNYSWPLEETTTGTVTRGNGNVDLTMNNVLSTDFVACCLNNMSTGNAFVHRPSRIDLTDTTSQSVLLVHAKDYSATAPKLSLLKAAGTGTNPFEVWDHSTKTWRVPTGTSDGISYWGNPSSSTRFWLPISRGSNTDGSGRYVDDGSDTGYDGADTNAVTQTQYNTIAPLASIIAMSSPFYLTGSLTGTTQYPTTVKYVVLGYDQVQYGTLISGTSTTTTLTKDGKGVATFSLASDVPIKRIEIRTQDDILLTSFVNPTGWSSGGHIGDTTLPVELTSFTALAFGNTAQLNWNSASESNLLGYYVYRSTTNDYGTAQQVSPLIEATNTSSNHSYAFTDSEVVYDTMYYYWLLAVEYNGQNSLHGPVSLKIENPDSNPEIPIFTGLSNIYPNPFNPTVNIRYGLKSDGDVSLKVYNMKGQKVKTWMYPSQKKGYYNLIWDSFGEPSGVYLLVFESGKTRETRKLTITK